MLDSISLVTRSILITTLVLSLAPLVGLIPSFDYVVFFSIPEMIIARPWTMLTTFFVIPSIPNLFYLIQRFYGLYTHSQALEISYFMNIHQYLYYLFFNMSFMILSTFYFKDQLHWFMEPNFYVCLSFTYAMCFWDNDIKYYGFIPMKVRYTIVIELLFNLVMCPNKHFFTGSGFMGALSAYVYNCLATQSWGPVYGFLKHKVLNIKEPEYINEVSYNLKGDKKVIKVKNPKAGPKSKKLMKEYGYGGGKPLYPSWFDSLVNMNFNKIKIQVAHKTVDKGVKLDSSVKIEKAPSADEKKANAKEAVANHWANKY